VTGLFKGADSTGMHLDLHGTAGALALSIQIAKGQAHIWPAGGAGQEPFFSLEIGFDDIIDELVIHSRRHNLTEGCGEAVKTVVIYHHGNVIARGIE